MSIRTVLIGAIALVLSAASASAQGKAPKTVAISQTVMKSMTANKSKSKTQLGARVGIVRKSSTVANKATATAPTSVREIAPIAAKK